MLLRVRVYLPFPLSHPFKYLRGVYTNVNPQRLPPAPFRTRRLSDDEVEEYTTEQNEENWSPIGPPSNNTQSRNEEEELHETAKEAIIPRTAFTFAPRIEEQNAVLSELEQKLALQEEKNEVWESSAQTSAAHEIQFGQFLTKPAHEEQHPAHHEATESQ